MPQIFGNGSQNHNSNRVYPLLRMILHRRETGSTKSFTKGLPPFFSQGINCSFCLPPRSGPYPKAEAKACMIQTVIRHEFMDFYKGKNAAIISIQGACSNPMQQPLDHNARGKKSWINTIPREERCWQRAASRQHYPFDQKAWMMLDRRIKSKVSPFSAPQGSNTFISTKADPLTQCDRQFFFAKFHDVSYQPKWHGIWPNPQNSQLIAARPLPTSRILAFSMAMGNRATTSVLCGEQYHSWQKSIGETAS